MSQRMFDCFISSCSTNRNLFWLFYFILLNQQKGDECLAVALYLIKQIQFISEYLAVVLCFLNQRWWHITTDEVKNIITETITNIMKYIENENERRCQLTHRAIISRKGEINKRETWPHSVQWYRKVILWRILNKSQNRLRWKAKKPTRERIKLNNS